MSHGQKTQTSDISNIVKSSIKTLKMVHIKKKKSLEKKIITFGECIRWHIRSREATKKG